jgi:hypothetical protein
MWVDSEGDENHVFVVDLTNDIITMNKWGGVGRRLVHTSKFASFMALKVVVCIGSDSVKDVFSVHVFGWVWWASDVYVCPNGSVWADM